MNNFPPHSFEDFGMKFHKNTLPNGSSVFLFQKKGAPIYITASVNAGRRWENIPGTAHFVEHMLVAGSEKLPSKDTISDQVALLGGDFGAATSTNTIRVDIQITEKSDIGLGIDILQEMLFHSLFNPTTFEKEKQAIFSEIRRWESNPGVYAYKLFSEMVFQGTRQGFTLQTEESTRQIDIKYVKEFYSQYVSPDRIAYIVCGDIEMGELMNAFAPLADINLSGVKNSFPLKPEIVREQSFVSKHSAHPETHIVLGWRADTATEKEKAALTAAAMMLGGGRGSLLMKHLRYEKGLVYGVNASHWNISDAGVFNISTSCTRENTQAVIDGICAELRTAYEKGFSEDVFHLEQNRWLKSQHIALETAKSWVYTHEPLLNKATDKEMTIIDQMNIAATLSVEDVNEVFRKYIRPNTWYLSLVGGNDTEAPRVDF